MKNATLLNLFAGDLASCPLEEYAGLANGFIEDRQLSVSSELTGFEGNKGRMNGDQAWCTAIGDGSPWFKVLNVVWNLLVLETFARSKIDYWWCAYH